VRKALPRAVRFSPALPASRFFVPPGTDANSHGFQPVERPSSHGLKSEAICVCPYRGTKPLFVPSGTS
jgi:hypothetical protein